jgi:hypothetical protein
MHTRCSVPHARPRFRPFKHRVAGICRSVVQWKRTRWNSVLIKPEKQWEHHSTKDRIVNGQSCMQSKTFKSRASSPESTAGDTHIDYNCNPLKSRDNVVHPSHPDTSITKHLEITPQMKNCTVVHSNGCICGSQQYPKEHRFADSVVLSPSRATWAAGRWRWRHRQVVEVTARLSLSRAWHA